MSTLSGEGFSLRTGTTSRLPESVTTPLHFGRTRVIRPRCFIPSSSKITREWRSKLVMFSLLHQVCSLSYPLSCRKSTNPALSMNRIEKMAESFVLPLFLAARSGHRCSPRHCRFLFILPFPDTHHVGQERYPRPGALPKKPQKTVIDSSSAS